jgi:hypothetical protein
VVVVSDPPMGWPTVGATVAWSGDSWVVQMAFEMANVLVVEWVCHLAEMSALRTVASSVGW